MRRLVVVVVALLILPHGVALGADLGELLEESRSASYTGEQLIQCNTPDGPRDALIDLEQRAGEVRYGDAGDTGPDVWSGFGGWVVQSGGSVIDSANVDDEDQEVTESRYTVELSSESIYLGRRSVDYVLMDGTMARAELVVDKATGVLMRVVTFDSDGTIYCERRFVSYNPNAPDWPELAQRPVGELSIDEDSTLPEALAGFTRLDAYVDEAGLNFGYYSDGFFSFAVFESMVEIVLEGGSEYVVNDGIYLRAFSPGQVTYTWPIQRGGMALIGDLPPDMHDAVLEGLPQPQDPGFFRRLWRSLFG